MGRYRFGVLMLSVMFGACWSQSHARSADDVQPDYAPVATVKDLMDGIVDPSADVVWNSVRGVTSGDGIEQMAPRSDEQWTEARLGAIRLAEGANLLMIPGRHVARPGEKSSTPGVELEPEQIDASIAKDRATWNKLTRALRDSTMVSLRAIEAKDPQAVFESGDAIDTACENCHEHYWYPDQPLPPGYR
jgi:hypothetical protein